jgi:hypothetical protein
MASRTQWSDAAVFTASTEIAERLGHFPSNNELRKMGRNDLACAITKRGGIFVWAERIGIPRRRDTDSDFGWLGERAVCRILRERGYRVRDGFPLRHPFDLLVNDVVRVDVKVASRASYMGSTSLCSGWFFRIGKPPQSDVIALHLIDLEDTFLIPASVCPHSNITITTAGKYEQYRNRWEVIDQIESQRPLSS